MNKTEENLECSANEILGYYHSFNFKGKSSRDFNMFIKYDNREGLPSKEMQEIELSSRHGTVDYQRERFIKRNIDIKAIILPDNGAIDTLESWASLRAKIERIGNWLGVGGRGVLIFSDQPYREYLSTVSDGISVSEWENLPIAELTFTFDSQPYFYITNEDEGNIEPEVIIGATPENKKAEFSIKIEQYWR